MKLSLTHILLLSGSMVLLLDSASAQERQTSKPGKQQLQQAKPPSAQQTAEPRSLEGSYTLKDQTASTKIVDDAIESAVKGMWILIRGRARDKLRQANLPPPQQITISYIRTEVAITTEAGTIQTPVDGTVVDRTIRGEKFKVSTKWKDGTLERTIKAGDGERVNTYILSGDGKTLTLSVRLNSKWLKRPGTYELFYDIQQVGDLAKLKEVTGMAQRHAKARFDAIERSPQGYDPADIAYAAKRGKYELVEDLKGDSFAALKAYIEIFYPIPFEVTGDNSIYATQHEKDDAFAKSVEFVRRIGALSAPGRLAVDVTIDSEPDMADYEMFAKGGNPLTTTTNNVLQNVYRGWYTYKLSKPGYKTIEAYLDLVDGGSKLKCKMNKTTDSDGPHACKQQ